MSAPLVDAEARRRIAEDLDTTLVVEAAAGTGKTTALVGRIVALVARGVTTLGRLVAVTFTEKAAGEMKLRLREALETERADADDEVRPRLERALRELEAARIATIHSLCHDILRERPVEAGVDPAFAVLPEPDARRLFESVFDRWFQQTLAAPPEGVRRLLRRPARDEASRPRNAMLRTAWDLADRRDFPTPWERAPFDRAAALDGVIEQLRSLASLRAKAEVDHNLVTNLDVVSRWLDELAHRESVRERDHDGLEVALVKLSRERSWKWKGYGKRFGGGLTRDQVLERRDEVLGIMLGVVESCEADLAPKLRDELWPLVGAYEEAKVRAGALDFLDLLLRARDLIARDAGVRGELQQRFSHVLLDEFQDTDPLQAEIALLLTADDPETDDPAAVAVASGKLFIVGDPKQSIYRFRRADVSLYHAIVRRLIDGGAERLHLSTSFRSDPRIQRFVNAIFAPRMQGGQQAEYVPLEPFRAPSPRQPAVIALPAPEIYGKYGTVVNWQIDASLPTAAGAWIDWLLNSSGWMVSEPGVDEPVPVEARHVCLLFRRFVSFGNAVTRPYIEALERRGIAHALVGGRSFHDREEVLAMRSALTAIEWPDDELSVFATLKGPLFGVRDDALLAWRERFRSIHPLHPTEPGDDDGAELHEVYGVLEILADLHRRRNRRPVAETVSDLLKRCRAHAGLALWNAGRQVLANVLRVVDMAHRFEARRAWSFRAFVEQLESDAERGEQSEAPVVEDGTEGVRVMTVHRAKGLAFPVVIVCDPTCSATPWKPSRHVDEATKTWYAPMAGCVPTQLLAISEEVKRREEEESERLLYVAATRARDVLVVPVIGDEPTSDAAGRWWTAPFNAAAYPPLDARGHGAPAAGCPDLDGDTVRDRPPQTKGVGPTTRPGLHATSGGDVVWWAPDALDLDREAPRGLQRWELLQDDGENGRARASRENHEAWRRRREATRADAATPQASPRSPSDGGDPPGDAREVRWETTDAAGTLRPHGRRFGDIVHRVLEIVRFDADDGGIEAAAVHASRLFGGTDGERAAAVDVVAATLRHALLDEARRSDDCRREVPFVTAGEGDKTIEGSIDLCFRDADTATWTVIDFKTTVAVDEETRAKYEAQVRWYARAVEDATGESAVPVVLML